MIPMGQTDEGTVTKGGAVDGGRQGMALVASKLLSGWWEKHRALKVYATAMP